jgi:hypothetical protein
MVKKRRKVKIEITDMPEDPGLEENELADDELENVAGGTIVSGGKVGGVRGMQAGPVSRLGNTALGRIGGIRVGTRGKTG